MASDKVDYWAKIPLMIQQDVIESLCYKDRVSLKQSSKNNMQLVESIPVKFMEVGFDDIINLGNDIIKLHIQEKPQIIGQITKFSKFNKSGAREHIFEIFFDILANRKSKIDFFYFSFRSMTGTIWTGQFINRLQEQPEDYLIRAKTFSFGSIGTGFDIVEIVKRLDPNYLEGIELNVRLTVEEMQQVMNTEQFQRAKHIVLGERCHYRLPVERLLHGNRIFACTLNATEREIWQCIRNFRSQLRPENAVLHIYSKQELFSVQRLLRFFGVPVIDYSGGPSHTQYFSMSNENTVLKVKINSMSVVGKIMNKIDAYYD